jgi:hypothetical protein
MNPEETIKTANALLDGLGARKPRSKNPKPDDKITVQLSRDDCVGLHHAMKGILCCSPSLYHKMAEHALNRSIWTHEFADPSIQQEFSRLWNELLKRKEQEEDG